MAELSADIILRTEQVNQKLRDTGRKFREAGDNIGAAMAGANAKLKEIPEQLDKVNKKVRRSSIIWFQAGQAISDFAAAGILGAANNIEFLAAQIGLGGPLLAGIAVATTAFIVFGDDILHALDPTIERVKDLKEGLEEIIEVVEQGTLGIPFLREQLPAIINEIEAAIDRVNKKLEEAGGAVVFSPFGAQVSKPKPEDSRFTELQSQLADLETFIEKLRKEQEKYENQLLAAGAEQNSQTLQYNQLRLESIRNKAKELDLEEEISKVSNGRLLLLDREGKIQKFLDELQERKANRNKAEKTELEKAVEANQRIKERLEALRNVDTSRLGAILDQNKHLEDQIKVVMRLNAERRKQGGGLGIEGLTGVTPAGLQSENQPIGELIEDLKKRAAAERKQLLDPRGLGQDSLDFFEQATAKDEEVIEAMRGIAEGTNQTAEAFRKAGIDAAWFYTQTEEGTLRLMDATSQLAGGISNAFYQAFQASGESQKGFFKAFKAFGIAEAIISTYVAANKALAEGGPILGPIMAAAMIAQGFANVARIKAVQPGGAGGAGGGITTSSTPPGRIDPREGRRFRRNTTPGYYPEVPSGMLMLEGITNIKEWNFTLRGEDLVASADATNIRQNRTRNVMNSTTRGVGR